MSPTCLVMQPMCRRLTLWRGRAARWPMRRLMPLPAAYGRRQVPRIQEPNGSRGAAVPAGMTRNLWGRRSTASSPTRGGAAGPR